MRLWPRRGRGEGVKEGGGFERVVKCMYMGTCM